MRNAFAAEVTNLAIQNDNVVLLTGDIGNRLFDDFQKQCPDRFFNCGVAEANMMGVAAGMAMNGLRPVAYTITPFITTRCLEQIRVDVCYHNVPVVIVGTGSGLSYASLGATHHSCEDIGFLRLLPNMTVVCPGDPVEAQLAIRAALSHDGPVYIRLGKKGEPVVHNDIPAFELGRGIEITSGTDVCLVSTGNMLPIAVAASQELKRQHGTSAGVISMHTVKPLDVDLLRATLQRCPTLVTIEEHSLIGGLGAAVAEWLADNPQPGVNLIRIGTPDAFLHEAGGQSHARELFGLTVGNIVEKVHAGHEVVAR